MITDGYVLSRIITWLEKEEAKAKVKAEQWNEDGCHEIGNKFLGEANAFAKVKRRLKKLF